MNTGQPWTWNDGWILMATYLSRNSSGVALNELIAAADGINHAIPTAKELSKALTKLSRAGIVLVVDGRYFLNEEALTEIEKVYKAPGGLFQSAKKGEAWLKSLPAKEFNQSDIVITENDVATAFKAYKRALRKRK